MPPASLLSPTSRRGWSGTGLTRRALPMLCGIVALACLGTAPAVAQSVSPCDSLLATAQRYYIDQYFERAEATTAECLAQPDVPDEAAIEAYRLRALVFLRQDYLEDAKQTVIRLLGISFDYEPDPVQDLPTYVALVRSIKEQLRVQAGDRAAALPEPAPATTDPPPLAPRPRYVPYRTPGMLSLRVALGAGSYGGERGIDEGSPFREFTSNGGVSIEIGASYRPASEFAVALTYRATRFPLLLENDVRPEDVQVRPGDSSAWVHLLTLLAQRTFVPDRRVAPSLHLGVTGSLGRLNETLHVGVGPLLGLGLDVALTPDIGAFADVSVTAIYPGDAVDRIDTSSAFGDVLTFLGAGVRYRVYTPPRRRSR